MVSIRARVPKLLENNADLWWSRGMDVFDFSGGGYRMDGVDCLETSVGLNWFTTRRKGLTPILLLNT